jgi:DNA-binding CsgD family transcriptional regulator
MHTTQTAVGLGALACAVAILGDGASVGAATQLAGLEPDNAERAADTLAADGILAPGRPLRFANPALRNAIYMALPPGERAIGHRRAVRLLAESGAGVAAVAAQACAVEPGGDTHVADALIAGGRGALAAGAPRQAALLLARALAEPPRADSRPAARALLASALTLLGDRRAPGMTATALAEAAPREREGTAAQLVDAFWLTGAVDAALAIARSTAETEPSGIAAARAARDGALAASDIVHAASDGVRGATGFERACAIAALIACDELEAARAAVAVCARAATVRGAVRELAVLQRLRARLRAVEEGVVAGGPMIPGPDPGAAPWRAWLDDAEAVERFGTPSARAAALLTRDGDAELLERAVALLRDSPRLADLCRAQLALGRALRHGGNRRAARAALAESLMLAQRLAVADVARDAREELQIAGARPRRERLTGPDSLTVAERRVADAAAAGCTNREIAERMFLSSKTVEMHLGRVYRKLDIGSRGDLAGVLGPRLQAVA